MIFHEVNIPETHNYTDIISDELSLTSVGCERISYTWFAGVDEIKVCITKQFYPDLKNMDVTSLYIIVQLQRLR